jgi:hypothetical protein
MSAIADSTDGPIEVVKVLFTLYPNYNTLDVAGPLEVLNRSLHDPKDKSELPQSSPYPFVHNIMLVFDQPLLT